MEPCKVVNLRVEPYDVYIGRPSIWGNPFSHIRRVKNTEWVSTIEEAITSYETYIRIKLQNDLKLKKQLLDLQGKVLGCFCKPGPCHGDILINLIKEFEERDDVLQLLGNPNSQVR